MMPRCRALLFHQERQATPAGWTVLDSRRHPLIPPLRPSAWGEAHEQQDGHGDPAPSRKVAERVAESRLEAPEVAENWPCEDFPAVLAN